MQNAGAQSVLFKSKSGVVGTILFSESGNLSPRAPLLGTFFNHPPRDDKGIKG